MGSVAFKKHIFPVIYLIKGLTDYLKPFLIFIINYSALLIVVLPSILKENPPPEVILSALAFFTFIPIMLVMFSVPSTYAHYGIKSHNVDAMVEYFVGLGIQDVSTVELIEEHIVMVKERIFARITYYKWLIGSLWAFFTFLLNQQLNTTISSNPNSWIIFITNNAIPISLFIAMSLIAISMIYGYKRASEILIRTVEFGLIEMKQRLNNPQKSY